MARQTNCSKIEENEFEDELDDQLEASLFQEAENNGIFQVSDDMVDYAQALKNIHKNIEEMKKNPKPESDQIDSSSRPGKGENPEPNGDEFENDELYDQTIDDEGNLVAENIPKLSTYEKEYNEVIQVMSKICRHIVYNNEPKNKDKKLKINEEEIE